MNNDLISRSELKKAIEKETCNFELPISANEIMPIIDNAPTVEERPQGEWIYDGHNSTDTDTIFRCSVCHREIHTTIDKLVDYPFCHCGAKMKGGEEE